MKLITALLMVLPVLQAFSQGLESIPPVLLDSGYAENNDSSTSFILNALDFHSFAKQGQALYLSSVEIIDADQPWPPRWFTFARIPLRDSMTGFEDMYMDARVQENGQVTFYSHEATVFPTHTDAAVNGYVICNNRLQPIDTFSLTGFNINYHEFRINAKGEKLAITILDTVLDMSDISGNPGDTALKATVDLISIFDADNKLILQWNPVKALGASAFYWPYRWDKSFSAKPGYLDWSHCNAADWDFDGNIIYSFRNIGIGKFAKRDGHVIWHFDRNKMPYISGTDTIAFYMQHGLEKVNDDSLYTTYELYSNGDYVHHTPSEPDHPGAYGLLFKVSKKNNSLRMVKKKMPHTEILSRSSGNYEMEKNGDYLISYGFQLFRKQLDTNSTWSIMEYGNKKGQVQGIYNMPVLIVPFKVHRLHGWRPPRPNVTIDNDLLVAHGDMSEWSWYQLTWPYKTSVVKVGEGASFSPSIPGIYYVTGKYGLGYSASLPFFYKL